MHARSDSSVCPAGCGHKYVRKTQKVLPATGGRIPFLIIQITSYVFGAIPGKRSWYYLRSPLNKTLSTSIKESSPVRRHGNELPARHADRAYSLSHSVLSNSLRTHGLSAARLLCPRDVPDKNTGMGCRSLLQGIFLTQGIEPRSPGLQADCLLSEPPVKAMLSTYIHKCSQMLRSFLIFKK